LVQITTQLRVATSKHVLSQKTQKVKKFYQLPAPQTNTQKTQSPQHKIVFKNKPFNIAHHTHTVQTFRNNFSTKK
jgi:hypothetical protein